MSDYIERDKALDKFIEGDGDDEFTEGYNFAVNEYRAKIKAMPSADVQDEIETLKAQIIVKDKLHNELLDYVKTSICPTCDNCCSLCPVLESNFVQCCCCGKSIPLLSAYTDLNGDYICRQCEEEGAE